MLIKIEGLTTKGGSIAQDRIAHGRRLTNLLDHVLPMLMTCENFDLDA
jgi:hypothetical protein